MDRRDILASTYQMRNMYRQLGDGFFTQLDVANYIVHHQVARWSKPGMHLLDVCCGRGLLLPLLRYIRPDLASYTGVDIEPRNATWLTKRVTDGKELPPDYYPFPVEFVHSNAAEMAGKLTRRFDLVVYLFALEHMQKEAGEQSIRECRKVMKPGATLVITCPRTPEDRDGWDVQYKAAHVYEWKVSELHAALESSGFEIQNTYGVMVNISDAKKEAERIGLGTVVEQLSKFVPGDWLASVLAPYFTKVAKEVGVVARAR